LQTAAIVPENQDKLDYECKAGSYKARPSEQINYGLRKPAKVILSFYKSRDWILNQYAGSLLCNYV
jgi:hypothetical protein